MSQNRDGMGYLLLHTFRSGSLFNILFSMAFASRTQQPEIVRSRQRIAAVREERNRNIAAIREERLEVEFTARQHRVEVNTDVKM